MKKLFARGLAAAIAPAILLLAGPPAWADGAPPVASDWSQGFDTKARLIAGSAVRRGKNALYAGVEIAMPDGWKTYWRSPGDAGGVPPEFDWQGSENLASAVVLYPAPHRLHDKAGDAVGYKNGVLFPVLLAPKDTAKPITLHGKVDYGICKDICVPAEAELEIVIPPGIGNADALSDALKQVPGPNAHAGVDPSLSAWRVDAATGKPQLILDIATASPSTVDAFLVAPGGVYVPLPKRVADAGGQAVFNVDLTDGVDIKDLKGKPLIVTLVDAKGQSETTITLE